MNASTWIALAALAVAAVGPAATVLHSGGKRDGKIDAALEQTSKILADHEGRLRKGGL